MTKKRWCRGDGGKGWQRWGWQSWGWRKRGGRKEVTKKRWCRGDGGNGGGGKGLGSFRKHVLQHLHGVAASCANRHFRERPQKDHTFSRKTTHPARGAPPHSYCTGSTSKTKESVFCKKGPCGLFSPTYYSIFRDLQKYSTCRDISRCRIISVD